MPISQEAKADKVLWVAIPVEQAKRKYRLTITIEPETTPEERGWPPGSFERTAGCWEGELKREPEGDYERRDPL